MTTHNPDRLDRIEALLERFIESSAAYAYASDERMTRLEQAMQENIATIKDLKLTIETLADQAKADRVVMHEVIDQLVTVRDENKRILDYLFSQQRGNGHGDQPEP